MATASKETTNKTMFIRLPKKTHRSARLIAVLQGRTLEEVGREAMEQFVRANVTPEIAKIAEAQ